MGAAQVTFELKEPANPVTLLPPDYFWTEWIATALLVLVVVVAWVVWHRRRRAATTPQGVRQLAYQEASGALAQLAAANAREAAVRASLILRRYLSLAADDPSLFETHEEFIARNDALHSLTQTARDACALGFVRLAACKYAPQIPESDSTRVVAESQHLLETLHRGFPD
jgi:hypothetical protein